MQYFKTAISLNDNEALAYYEPELSADYAIKEAVVGVLLPPDEETGVDTRPTFKWENIKLLDPEETYLFQLSKTPDFSTIIYQERMTITEFDLPIKLEPFTKYYCRVPLQTTSDFGTNYVTGVSITGPSALEVGTGGQYTASFDGVGNYPENPEWSVSPIEAGTISVNGFLQIAPGFSDAELTINVNSAEFPDITSSYTVSVLPVSSGYTPEDSSAGDKKFLDEFYAATQGQGVEVLSSVSELPDPSTLYDLEHRFVGDDFYYFDGDFRVRQWVNMGPVWTDKTNWNNGDVDLANPPVGVSVDVVDNELRVVEFDMQKIRSEGTYNGNQIWDGNVCVGTLPPSWGNLTKCKKFNVKQNFLFGEIPDTLQPTSEIEYIILGGQEGEEVDSRAFSNTGDHRGVKGSKEYEERNKFSGPLPKSIGNLPAIYWVEIRRQYLTGTLPPEWGNATTLKHIYLSCQKGIFGGELPPEWGNLNPSKVDLNGDPLARDPYAEWTHRHTGTVPDSWNQNWTELSTFFAARNELEGVIPDFPNAFDKRHLSVDDNNFVSPPGEYIIGPGIFDNGGNRRLALLEINRNNLSGKFREFVQPARPDQDIEYFNIYTWQIEGLGASGPYPKWLNDVPNMAQFNISNNNFDPEFPLIIAERENVKLFDLDNAFDISNGGIGDLPDVNWKQKHQNIDFAGTGATGPIPASWQSMQTNEQAGIWQLNWQDNELEGLVPGWLADMRDLTRLYLQNNRFTYKDLIPHYEAIKNNVLSNSKFTSPRINIGPQKRFNVPQETYSVSAGQTITVDLSSIDYTNNVYQWRKLDSGEVSGQTTHTLSIANASASDAGIYELRITNPDLPELQESISKEITINVT